MEWRRPRSYAGPASIALTFERAVGDLVEIVGADFEVVEVAFVHAAQFTQGRLSGPTFANPGGHVADAREPAE